MSAVYGAGALRVEAGQAGGDGPRAVGRITFVDNAVDQTTGTIKIKGFPTRSNALARPGRQRGGPAVDDPGAIVVPTVAVQTGPDGAYVYVVKDDKTVDLRPVICPSGRL